MTLPSLTRTQWLTLLTLAGVVLVVGFCVKRDQDRARDQRIEQLDSLHAVDSTARVAAERVTDSVLAAIRTAGAVSARVDTLWRTRSVTIVNTVHDIAHDTTLADSTKIVRLVAQVDTLKQWGDSVARDAERFRAVALSVPALIQKERDDGTKERADLVVQVALLKKQSRHWGLGASLGYGATKVGQTITVGPQVTVGFVYRW